MQSGAYSTSIFDNQDEAIISGTTLATRRAELIVHGNDGAIRKRIPMATTPGTSKARARTSERSPDLDCYQKKRNFGVTTEPAGTRRRRKKADPLRFVIQKHWARRLHYDFRLELDGVLLSWAVPKGPCYDPGEKRIAIHVEDHPLDYATFEGEIPAKQYGAGSVIVWDRGTWAPIGDPREGMAAGKLLFDLFGEKLAGRWELVRIAKPGDKSEQWILFKKRDAWARPLEEFDVLAALPDSVIAKPLGALTQASTGTTEMASDTAIANAPLVPLPATLRPQLATPAPALPTGTGWVIETKFDGYRILARIEDAHVTLFTRNGHDWTRKLGLLAAEIEKLDISEGWLDGEIVVLRDGMPDFNALQNAIDGGRNDAIVFFSFDLPFWEGRDLRNVPLAQRRAKLAELVADRSERVRFSEAFDASAVQLFQAACQLGLEGLMFKRADASYVSARTQTWLKAKCNASRRQLGFQQLIEPLALVGGQALRDLAMERGFGHGMGLLRDLIERPEGRQFVAQPNQFLDRDVDDVHACVHHAGGFLGESDGDEARLGIGVRLDAQQGADHLVMPIARGMGGGIGNSLNRCHAQGGRHVLDDFCRHPLHCRKVAQELETLQVDQKREAPLSGAGEAMRPLDFLRPRGERGMQIFQREGTRKPRIGSSFVAGHARGSPFGMADLFGKALWEVAWSSLELTRICCRCQNAKLVALLVR